MNIEELLTNLENSYNPNSPTYKFTFTFFNILSTSLYPITLKGYSDLKNRVNQQKQITTKLENSLSALSVKLEKIISKGIFLEKKMIQILQKIRKSDLRSQKLSSSGNFKNLNEIPNFESNKEFNFVLEKMRLVLRNLNEAVKNEINSSN